MFFSCTQCFVLNIEHSSARLHDYKLSETNCGGGFLVLVCLYACLIMYLAVYLSRLCIIDNAIKHFKEKDTTASNCTFHLYPPFFSLSEVGSFTHPPKDWKGREAIKFSLNCEKKTNLIISYLSYDKSSGVWIV